MTTPLSSAITAVLDLKTLKPNETVNRTMSALVASVIDNNTQTIPKDSVLKAIRSRASLAESELEMYWSHRISTAENATQELAKFPYRYNYAELARREIQQLKNTGLTLSTRTNVLVIGSGPLPLTAYELYKQTSARVDQIDISADAAALGKAFCKHLSMPTTYLVGDGTIVTPPDSYDVILIAALAGETTKQKQAIISNIVPHLKRSGRIVLRSAKGLRTVLYPEIQLDCISEVKLLSEYHPNDKIINSVLIFEANTTNDRSE
jgi:nicotianamine synthase